MSTNTDSHDTEADERRFAWAEELDLPEELKEYAKMYPEYFQFGLSSERTEYEHSQFWFWDKKDTTQPVRPFDILLCGEVWQVTMGQNPSRVFAIPPSMGFDFRFVGGYAYMSPLPVENEELIGERAEEFGKRSQYAYENFEELYNEKWLPHVQEIGRTIKKMDVPTELPRYVPDETVFESEGGSQQILQIMQNYEEMVGLIFEAWQRHFEFLFLVYLAYHSFHETCQELFPGISDDAVGKMVAGVKSDLFRPDEELDDLAELAVDLGGDVPKILTTDLSPDKKIERLEDSDAGREFLKAFDERKDPWFYLSYGDGYHSADGSWIDDLEAPFNHLKTKVGKLQAGEDIGRNFEQLQAERGKIVEEYRSYIDDEEGLEQFNQSYDTCMGIYEYAEDHQFWIEHWLHTIVFQKMRTFGQLAVNEDLLEDSEDIFMFNRYEVSELFEELAGTWSMGPTAFVTQRWKNKAAERWKIMEAAHEWNPPSALGHAPERMEDPMLQMLFGIDTAKINDWLAAESNESPDPDGVIEGFSSSAGRVEGLARVITTPKEINGIQEGEILVCPLTNPTWAPVFPRIGGAVTDDGGITSHAAIVCREYGVPAVTGTDHATESIATGDRIRVDGEAGTVEIIERAE